MPKTRDDYFEYENEFDWFEILLKDKGLDFAVGAECGKAEPLSPIPPEEALILADMIYAKYKQS